MITLTLVRPVGNAIVGGHFPYAGVFGYSDVVVAGKVHCSIDNRASGIPPPVRAVHVRIRRIDQAFGGEKRILVVDQALLWDAEREEGKRAAQLGQRDLPFRLVVPYGTEGPSHTKETSAGSVARFAWKLETFFIGDDGRPGDTNSSDLLLIRHDTQPLIPPSCRDLPSSSSSTIPLPPRYLSWTENVGKPTSSSKHGLPFSCTVRLPNKPVSEAEQLVFDVEFQLPALKDFKIVSFEPTVRRTITALEGGRDSVLNLDIRPNGSNTTAASGKGKENDPAALHFPLRADPHAPTTVSGTYSGYIHHNRWKVGESCETETFKVQFQLSAKIKYKTKRSGYCHTLDFRPVHIVGNVLRDPPPFRKARPSFPLLSNAPTRRNSDFAQHPLPPSSSASSSSSPLSPAAPSVYLNPALAAIKDPRRHSTATLQPVPFSGRPLSGRRMSEQSDSIAEPARTRARREPPVPIAVPALVHSSASTSTSAASSPSAGTFPPDGSGSVSRSSTVETLGPDTPNTLEFLLSPAGAPLARSSGLPTFPARPSTAPSPHPHSQLHQLSPPREYHHQPSTLSLSASAGPGPHRHPHRTSRAALGASARHSPSSRPKSAGSARSVSGLSISSFTSVTSAASGTSERDRRSMRELSAPLPGASSPTVLESGSGIPSLSLAEPDSARLDGGPWSTLPLPASPPLPRFAYQPAFLAPPVGADEDDTVMVSRPSSSSPSLSPPSSPEPSTPYPATSQLFAGVDPFAASSAASPSSAADAAVSHYADGLAGVEGVISLHKQAGIGEMYVSPMQKAGAAAGGRSGKGPLPSGLAVPYGAGAEQQQQLSPPAAAAKEQPRKKSLVMSNLLHFVRRSSKVFTPSSP
ncbi:hypothetical protein JCM8097_001123 [Rhodosporidiobolus ruineniae]